jgi:hypothetical protein
LAIALIAVGVTASMWTEASTPAHSQPPGQREGWGKRKGECSTMAQWREWATARCKQNKKDKVLTDVIGINGTECQTPHSGHAAGSTAISFRCEPR